MTKKTSETNTWLNYYKQALIEGAYLTEYKPKGKASLKDVRSLYGAEDILSDNMTKFIHEKISSKNSEDKFVLLPLQYTAPSGKCFYPFSIPFTAEKGNEDSIHINPPEKGSFPVISRKFLSPNDGDCPVIAELNDLWDAVKDIKEKEYDDWNTYIKDVFDVFKKVTKTEIGGNLGDGFSWDNLGVCEGGVFTVAHLQKLYNKITSDQSCLHFYDKLFSTIDRDESIAEENSIQMARHHFGHMDNKFSLSRTQREAIHSWIANDSLQDGKGHMRIMAVNGPPGTGKTTFLSGLIASHIVRSVYQKKYPRFMLTSFTNKAVTNILDSFSRCAKDIRIIETNNEIGLSIHFPREASDYPHLIMSGGKFEGSILKIEEQFKSKEAVDQYVLNAEKMLGLDLSKITSQKVKLNQISSFIYDQLCCEYQTISKLKAIDDIQCYDTGHRFNAFCWAIRWLECEWIKNRPENTDTPSKELMEWRMMLTPCVVGTVYKLPQFFEEKANNRSDNTYWFESVDYLIIDEAGQGCPENAIPLFGLAKNAIIVGDTEQLQPIWSISPDWDRTIQSRFFATEQNESAMFASSGSIMSVAQKVCPIKSQCSKVRGAILLNHRRCYKEIIELCNALCYSDQGYTLETNTSPKESSFYKTFLREDERKDPVFPLGMLTVNGQCTRDKVTGANMNQKEIDAIIEWVEKNWEKLVDSYAKKEDLSSALDKRALIKDVLAILTPYRGQERQIINALKLKGLYIKDHEIVVGTVHKLQGAEKAVVLFSTVLDSSKKSRPEFMDKHMLNVAVSRAKKSFIVFSNPALYDVVEDGSPLDIMKKYIDDWTHRHPIPKPINLPDEIIEEGNRIVEENCNLASDNSHLSEKNRRLNDERLELEEKVRKLEGEIKELKKESKRKDAKIIGLEQTVSNKTEEICSYRRDTAILKSDIENVQRKNNELNARIIKLDKKRIELEEIRNSPKMAFQTLFKAIIHSK